MSRPHVSFQEDIDEDDGYYDDDYEEEDEQFTPYTPPALKQTKGTVAPKYQPRARQPAIKTARRQPIYNIPRRRIVRPKPTYNGKTFALPDDGTKSQRKIFQTSILKEAYKLIQDQDPRLKGKSGSKLRLKICNQALKAFKSVYEDPNFLYFIQDPESCQSLIQDFAAELLAQLGNA